ncbi:MAG: hypothetical protein AB8H79_01395 [Myxococcota bacterium]
MTAPVAHLPEHAASWVRAALGRDPLAETHSTCSTCALCEGGGDGRRPQGRVTTTAQVKCCTYRPALPNYLVGAILSDQEQGSEFGHQSVRTRMTDWPAELSPLGLFPAVSDPAFLGASKEACPHLDEGKCGIWKHRHAVCSTYFCKFERGASGQKAWLALRAMLLAVERSLALWCCVEEGMPPAALSLVAAHSESVPGVTLHPSDSMASLWGDRGSDPEAFFRSCHARVKDLSWDQVISATGPAVRALAAAAKAEFDGLQGPIPNRLKPGRYAVTATSGDGVLAETYSAMDPIGLPMLLLSVLHVFDGRELDVVRQELQEQHGLGLDGDFLRALVDFRVLVAAD